MILICGGAGYIGSITAYQMQQNGFECLIFDNLRRGHKPAARDIPFIEGDLHDEALLDEVFQKYPIDAVVHFAANSLVGESVEKPLEYYDNNVCATMHLLNAMVRNNVKNIVFSSTAAVYGEPEQVPITEDLPKNPTSPYGETKLAIEKMLAWCDRAYGVKSVCLRYFNAAGALPDGSLGEDHTPESHLIPLVLQVALGKREHIGIFGDDYPTKDGTCIRDYIHVLDLADAHCRAVIHLLDGKDSDRFNLGSGEGYSVNEIIALSREITGHAIPAKVTPRRAGDPAVLIASSARAKETLGWAPKYSLRDIISSAWAWHSSHPNGYED